MLTQLHGRSERLIPNQSNCYPGERYSFPELGERPAFLEGMAFPAGLSVNKKLGANKMCTVLLKVFIVNIVMQACHAISIIILNGAL